MNHSSRTWLSLLLVSTVLFACTSGQYGRYQQKHDSIPTRLPSSHELEDAIPRAEPPSRGGNKNYQVRGKNYQVLASAKGFEQTGTASWYGKKFHGHLTSNGEIYNMYGMSAAHKNLPLPTYVKVTNTANNKSVIVRVNDRGPFHQNRVIDLSYSAAFKLDMLKTGTAQVRIQAITEFDQYGQAIIPGTTPELPVNTSQNTDLVQSIDNDVTSTPEFVQSHVNTATSVASGPVNHVTSNAPQINSNSTNASNSTLSAAQATPIDNGGYNKVIQVFATRDKNTADKTVAALSSLYQITAQSAEYQGLYRIQIGPFQQSSRLQHVLEQLKSSGYPNAFIKTLVPGQ